MAGGMFLFQGRRSRFPRRFISLYVVLSLVGLAFLGGLYVGGHRFLTAPDSKTAGGEVKAKDQLPTYLLEDVNFPLFWEVWNTVKDKYLEQPVLDTQLFYGALSGMVASLGDPYSVFLDPETTRKFTDELSGTFEGIGAEIGVRKGELVIIAPLPDTPAQRAGLKSGDAILKIDDQDTLGMPLDLAVSRIRGQKDTTVQLTVMRENWKEPRQIPIVREKINVQSVRLEEKEGGTMVLRLVYFNETTLPAFEEAVQKIIVKNPKGLMLDLRNNPGGFLEVAVKVASAWVNEGEVVVWQEFQGGQREAFRAQGQPRFKNIPTIVLVNEGSASASEIVAGALKDYGLAKLIGVKTFGKGSVQTFEELPGGSALKLTIAHWVTPKGTQINGTGIAPDVAVELSRDHIDNGDDPQLKKALELLTKP